MNPNQPEPGHQIWMFHPVTTEPVNLNNPGPEYIKPRKWRYRPKKEKSPCGCASNHKGPNSQPCPIKIGGK